MLYHSVICKIDRNEWKAVMTISKQSGSSENVTEGVKCFYHDEIHV